MRSPESVATVPATTSSPTPRRTGTDSPVTIDSLISAAPSTISPSAGTLPPGRTITTSPSRSSDGATVTVLLPAPPGVVFLDPFGFIGQQRGERVQRRAGLR